MQTNKYNLTDNEYKILTDNITSLRERILTYTFMNPKLNTLRGIEKERVRLANLFETFIEHTFGDNLYDEPKSRKITLLHAMNFWCEYIKLHKANGGKSLRISKEEIDHFFMNILLGLKEDNTMTTPSYTFRIIRLLEESLKYAIKHFRKRGDLFRMSPEMLKRPFFVFIKDTSRYSEETFDLYAPRRYQKNLT